METITTIKDMQARADQWRQEGNTIGFVPTMGALHKGHMSLVKIAREQADKTVVSVFVNPTQFGPREDLAQYPRDIQADRALLEAGKVDVLFFPPVSEMYPSDFSTWVTVEDVTETLCGLSRPGHFRGVATICTKLFHAVKPHVAVFGQKDAQQAVVIQRMVKDLDFDIRIVVGPIAREKDGLAMSSRNVRLSAEERRDALVLHRSLICAEDLAAKGETDMEKIVAAMREMINKKKRIRIDYIEIVHPETLKSLRTIKGKVLVVLAAFVGNVRLIDNAFLCSKNK